MSSFREFGTLPVLKGHSLGCAAKSAIVFGLSR